MNISSEQNVNNLKNIPPENQLIFIRYIFLVIIHVPSNLDVNLKFDYKKYKSFRTRDFKAAIN